MSSAGVLQLNDSTGLNGFLVGLLCWQVEIPLLMEHENNLISFRTSKSSFYFGPLSWEERAPFQGKNITFSFAKCISNKICKFSYQSEICKQSNWYATIRTFFFYLVSVCCLHKILRFIGIIFHGIKRITLSIVNIVFFSWLRLYLCIFVLYLCYSFLID